MPEPILIVGAGAIGCTVGAALADAGHTPCFAVRTPFSRLERRYADEVRHYDCVQVEDPAELGSYRFVLLCTKAYATEEAIAWLKLPLPVETTLAVLQNGVDQIERLSQFVPAEQVLPISVLMACARAEPGVAVQPKRGRITVPDNERGHAFAALFADDHAIVASAEADFRSRQWQKLGLNAVNGAICALTVRPNDVLAEAEVGAIARQLMAEVVAVGRAEGAEFPEDFIERTMNLLIEHSGAHWTSMAADRRDGRPMEWEVRNAVVGRLGRRYGVPTPLNDLFTTLLSVAT